LKGLITLKAKPPSTKNILIKVSFKSKMVSFSKTLSD
jgi:hypothetical protein